MKRLLPLLFLLTLPMGAWADATLGVTLSGVRSATGNLRVSVYREQDSFRKEAQAFRVQSVPAREGDVTLDFAALPPSRYAVMGYHDENANDKLDLRLGMFPLEGYGLSNNPKVFGPPAFADSAFDLPASGSVITLKLAY
ncbi:MAG: hypothetical protein CGU28_07565 [Candidatus Dactylopiibacterium carminicum]|uniref:DUF2141 domain-containing protein n=1 Tax=Candidatus Dactylopiibacterium carminicum TaxID=857335 RepID=A0A272EVN7_9RHOO|nr:DUF2141 domain-containing protein [Candidatus Dactylopiibacterium carminicum]KAF7599894.1 DUF2141 domain-containing protein [Candidatus Dactylopiibacterium carminicum]PAS94167.1 MAG: hypothetical protein CGU29_04910 [Candidatus Dactylopiibacterium carminicum]PAS96762.1 MAG: hypothetical protein CGU28_07565 [Candidatus Dactylopiibacterium carminicum]PAS99894.1 MAG: hypothetical protein BSR46_05465 [Candidatus Dactylopiibacterium carminicum]